MSIVTLGVRIKEIRKVHLFVSFILIFLLTFIQIFNVSFASTNSQMFVNLSLDKVQYSTNEKVTIEGTASSGTRVLPDRDILVEATQQNSTIYRTLTTTDSNGTYSVTFSILQPGMTKISASLYNSNISSVVSILVSQPESALDLLVGYSIVIVLLLAASFFIFIRYPHSLPNQIKDQY